MFLAGGSLRREQKPQKCTLVLKVTTLVGLLRNTYTSTFHSFERKPKAERERETERGNGRRKDIREGEAPDGADSRARSRGIAGGRGRWPPRLIRRRP